MNRFSLSIFIAVTIAFGAGCCDAFKKSTDETQLYADQAAASASKADSAARNAEMAAAEAKIYREDAVLSKPQIDFLEDISKNIRLKSGVDISHADIISAFVEALNERNVKIPNIKNKQDLISFFAKKLSR